MIMAAGMSSLVVPQNSSPRQMLLLQSVSGGLVQLMQLPAAVSQSPGHLGQQQVILAPGPAVCGSSLQLIASSVVNTSSVPVAQLVMSSTMNTSATSSITVSAPASGAARIVPASVLSSVPIVSEQTVLTSPAHSNTGPPSVSVANKLSLSSPEAPVQKCEVPSPLQQSAELAKNSGLAEAADLFLMAASVVDRATASKEGADQQSVDSGSVL